jgi:hypothetical protein
MSQLGCKHQHQPQSTYHLFRIHRFWRLQEGVSPNMHRGAIEHGNNGGRSLTDANAANADHRHDQEDHGQQQPQDFAKAALRREVRALRGEVGSFAKHWVAGS